MMAMGVRSRSLLVTALLLLVGSGAAKTITVDWDAAAGQTLTAANGDWIEFRSSGGWLQTTEGGHVVWLMKDKRAYDACSGDVERIVGAASPARIRIECTVGRIFYFACLGGLMRMGAQTLGRTAEPARRSPSRRVSTIQRGSCVQWLGRRKQASVSMASEQAHASIQSRALH